MLLLLFLLFANPILSGRVTDREGKPVSGAVVRLIVDGRAPMETSTDVRGRFRVDVPGRFQIEISHAGFRTLHSASSELAGDGVFQVDIPLTSGSPLPIENVNLAVANADNLSTRDEPGFVEALPRADRLFGLRGGINLTGIAEGKGQQWINASGNALTSSSLGTSVAENTDFSAERGDVHSVEEALPAGQDALHGSVYGFHRNNALNARNFFDPPRSSIPPFRYYFFGGDAGGKVRDGTYYYGQYWGLRIRQSITRAATVPDPLWLTGDFSRLPTLIIDPDIGLPFPDNRIPTDRFDPIGVALAKIYPFPNL
jgi:hypothetical protein